MEHTATRSCGTDLYGVGGNTAQAFATGSSPHLVVNPRDFRSCRVPHEPSLFLGFQAKK